MPAIQKPIFNTIWASEGGMSVPDLDQILTGWVDNQFPPSEVANFLQNKIETAISYLYQVGIPTWDNLTQYRVNSFAQKDGIVYLSKTENVDKDPSITPNSDWRVAFDAFGASDDLRLEVGRIVNSDGYLRHYVKKSDPVMDARAKAPSFEADVGTPDTARGYSFKQYPTTGLFNVGGDLLLSSGGVVNGRIKNTPPTLEMNDDTLVTTALLKKVIDQLEKKTQIPVGWSVITKNPKPPSDPAQLGYGVWVQDVQGRALVGVSNSTSVSDPEWIKDPDSQFGEYTKVLTKANLPSGQIPIRLETWVHGDDASGAGAILTSDRNYANGTQYPKNSWAELGGEDEPLSIVQPSQTKYIWTRVS